MYTKIHKSTKPRNTSLVILKVPSKKEQVPATRMRSHELNSFKPLTEVCGHLVLHVKHWGGWRRRLRQRQWVPPEQVGTERQRHSHPVYIWSQVQRWHLHTLQKTAPCHLEMKENGDQTENGKVIVGKGNYHGEEG